MPGIVGLISDRVEEALFNSMQNSMNHRSYSIDSYIKDGLHLSRIHLNFINTSNQPLHSSDGKCSTVFYGEIFSVEGEPSGEIKDSAIHFIELIAKHGLNILSKINGQFSACLYDHSSDTTYLISDRFGTHPLYYTINNNRFLFASEVKALLKDNIQKKIDFQGIGELFSFGHLFGFKTLFENIHQVPPATIVKYKQNSIEKSAYWVYPYSENAYHQQKISKKKSDELQEELGQILITATQQQSSHSGEILLPLSGGLDSRYVAALYHHNGARNLSTYTMGPNDSEDQVYATQVANMLGFPHSKFDIKPERTWDDAIQFSYVSDSMSSISGPLHNFEPLEHFSDTKKIVIASQMCDALFGSTLWRRRVRVLQKNEAPRDITNETLVNLFKLYDQNLIQQLFHPEVYKKIDGLYRLEPMKYCKNEYHPLHNYYNLLMNEHGRRGTLGGNIVINLYYQTRMLSYDNHVFDFGLTLPVAYREHQFLYRKTFSRLFPDLSRIKRQGYNLKIGASNTRYELKVLENKVATIARKSSLKHIVKLYKPWTRPSYVNYNTWFKSQLREKLVSFLVMNELKCRELINVDFVKILVNEHVEGKRDNSSLLWQVINLEYFYRNFID